MVDYKRPPLYVRRTKKAPIAGAFSQAWIVSPEPFLIPQALPPGQRTLGNKTRRGQIHTGFAVAPPFAALRAFEVTPFGKTALPAGKTSRGKHRPEQPANLTQFIPVTLPPGTISLPRAVTRRPRAAQSLQAPAFITLQVAIPPGEAWLTYPAQQRSSAPVRAQWDVSSAAIFNAVLNPPTPPTPTVDEPHGYGSKRQRRPYQNVYANFKQPQLKSEPRRNPAAEPTPNPAAYAQPNPKASPLAAAGRLIREQRRLRLIDEEEAAFLLLGD